MPPDGPGLKDWLKHMLACIAPPSSMSAFDLVAAEKEVGGGWGWWVIGADGQISLC